MKYLNAAFQFHFYEAKKTKPEENLTIPAIESENPDYKTNKPPSIWSMETNDLRHKEGNNHCSKDDWKYTY